MGNKVKGTALQQSTSSAMQIQTQLKPSSLNQEIYEEVQQNESTCFCFIKGKTVKKKVTWESKFIANCQKVKADFGYVWIDGLINIVRNNEVPKVKYLKEVHNLRKQKPTIKITQPQLLTQYQKVQKFKKNLKKSLIISFSQNRRHTIQRGTNSISASITIKKSRVDQHKEKKNEYISSLINQKLPVSRKISAISHRNSGCSEDIVDNQEVSEQTATELQNFMKFSFILLRHLGDINCILGCLRKRFVQYFQQKFRDSQSASQQLDLVIETVKVFIAILNAAVIDFYNLKLFGKDQVGSNMFISNEENISSCCTAILLRDHRFYNCLFDSISNSFKERQEKFTKILNFLAGSKPQRFQVKDKFCLNARTIKNYLNHKSTQSEEAYILQNIQINEVVVQDYIPYKACMMHLNEMAKSRSPINKLKCLMACSEGITVQIQKYYDINNLQKQKWALDADQMLSIFCYLLVGAKVQHLHTHLFLLDNFTTSLQKISMTGYYLSVLHCAVQQLQNQFGKEIEQGSGLQ